MNGGFLLVGDVDFVVNGNKIRNIQHIGYDQDTETLRARYMDTAGDASIYTWVLDGQKFRVTPWQRRFRHLLRSRIQ